MKSLHALLLALLVATAASPAFATTLTVTGNVKFSSLDGSADDSDPTPGVFHYNGTLVVDGTITCSDDAPLPAAASACPISIRTDGDLVVDAGGAIVAENRVSTGSGGDVTLAVGGSFTLHGPSGSLPGAIVSSSRPSTAGPHGSDHAGNIAITVGGATVLEAGSTLAANSLNSAAGGVQITGEGQITLGGLIASAPTSTLAATRWSGVVLTMGGSLQSGGAITITSHSTTAPGVQVTSDGVVTSEGQVSAGAIRIEACGIAVNGLVASVGNNASGTASVVLRSGKNLVVAGQDLLDSPAAGSTRLGRVRADSAQGGTGYHAYLLAHDDIQVFGPAAGTTALSAVSSDPSPNYSHTQGGTIDAVSLAGGITASGNAFEAGIVKPTGASIPMNYGGTIDLRAEGAVALDDASLKAVGDYATATLQRHGGAISVRSYQQGLSWTFGNGDVRPVGTGAPASVQGTISLTSCTTLTFAGTQFPVLGQPIQPFPATAQSCADAAPTLPAGEPGLPSCATTAPPVAADDAYTTPKGVTLNVVAPGVLANDTGTGLAATPLNAAPTTQGGTVTLHADGSFAYTPPAGFASPPDDSFTYTVTNGGGSSTATVRITVDAPPTVTSTVPSNGAGNVSLTSTVTINFSAPVNVTASAFRLECPSGTPVAFTVTPASPSASYVLHPSANLPAATTCTATVVASEVTDAAGTHLAADYVWSFGTTIVANDDLYPETVLGNVPFDSNAISYSVTANDVAGNSPTITAYDTTTAHGGSVVMVTSGAAIGRFTYNPPAGFQGADSFHYTISNGSSSSTATVSINVSGLIWFIDNHASAGDGRLTSPFNSLAAFQAVNDGAGLHPGASQSIFLYESGTDYTGPVTLLAGQKLIGQDATTTLAAVANVTPGASDQALPATNSANATIVRITSSGNGINLGQNNTVRGLTVGNTTGTAISGSGFGTLTVADVTVDTTGSALALTTGNLAAVFTKVAAGGGTHGIALTSTTGSLEVTGDGASDPANTTRGRTTAKNGGGTLNLGSGGTVTGATSAGVLLSNVTNVTLRNMTITANGSGINTGGDGITASGAAGLTLDNDLITNHAGNFGLHGTTVSNLTMIHTEISANATAAGTEGVDVWDVRFDDLTGTSSIQDALLYNSRENIVGLNEGNINPNATLDLTISNSEIRDTTITNPGNDALFIGATHNANVTLSVSNSTFLRTNANAIQYTGTDSSGGGKITVANSTFDNTGTDINIAHQGLGKTLDFDIHGNTLRQTVGGKNTSINIFLAGLSNATTLLRGKIQSNTIGTNAVANSGSANGKGIDLFASGAGTLTALVDSNTVRQIKQDSAFRAISSGHSGQINVTVTNNDLQVSTTTGLGLFGIDLTSGGTPGDTGTLCAHLASNVAAVGDPTLWGINAETVSGTPQLLLEGYSGAANNTAQINSFLNTTASTVSPPAQSFVFAGTIKAAPSPCATP